MQAVTGRMIKGDIDISKSPDPETNNQPRQSTEMDESYSTGQPRESIETDEPDSSLPDQSEAIEMCDGSQIASDESGSASKEPIGKFETNDIPLRSIAPSSIKERSPDLESQQGGDPETEPNLQLNSDTIRDHARQMKVLGKRLPSPDQKFVRRVRRDMRRFANLADERENEMAHNHPSVPSRPSSTSEHSQASSIDLFGRYKMLWKGALRESGSIPESLRELVRHDCDPNQLFYLEETEADFLAANAMRNENGQ
ncbi:hypothetical protein NXS19_009493 [Fusarium pseudograminearum]|nr:hypothetical protein NXS19_009493 [Fusarium pseudograminearum]